MFDWVLFIVLVGVCVPGALIQGPRMIKTFMSAMEGKASTGKRVPPPLVLNIVSFIQTLVLIALPAAVGTALAQRVGLGAPFFESLIAGGSIGDALAPQIFPTLIAGIGGALVFVAAYYLYFRPRLEEETVRISERLRVGIGIWGRLLFSGIAEEVIFRWGLMSFLVWLGALAFGSPTPSVMWTAIVVTGLIFAILHLPPVVAAGSKMTPILIAAAITLNLWASLIFGWLFWHYGLLAAIGAHMLLHLIWWRFDLHFYRPVEKVLAT